MGAKRYNVGKTRYELIPSSPLEMLADVYTKGAHKYTVYSDDNGNTVRGADITMQDVAKKGLHIVEDGADNWRLGQAWRASMASVKRHIHAWDKGEDVDLDLNTYHLANAAWGLFSLMEYYKSHPELDDRPNTFFNKRVALDIDGVLADFNKAVKKKFGIDNKPSHWYYSYSFNKDLWGELKQDKEFWLSIEPYGDGSLIPFEPVCYVTHRSIPKEWCEEWIEKNNFPCVPVHVVGGSKVDKLKDLDIDIFVDDKYDNFKELNSNGIFTYLLTQPWNERYDVGHKRIDSLSEILTK